jgi:predicted house-cleaning noncanonical NTP pyrophosphatase (MazG superfamily)
MREKLIRDNIPEIALKERGEVLDIRIAKQEEFEDFVMLKLLEETNEIISAKTKNELVEELADLMEVVKTLAMHHGIVNELFDKIEEKALERGSFNRKFILKIKEN